ncbi:hypothetical protein [uncultured Jatrophihabitans sp.]|uniref:hypothetical protein n=1 Tax=uncultured Jatrophihabitans sp. TaxID=1610747 RepID=UPI0035CB959B
MDDALVRIARGCHAPADQADELAGRCIAALATSAPDSVIASVTAARLHGLWLPDDLPATVHIATASLGVAGRAMTRTRRPEFVAHRFQLRPADIARVDGVAVTSLARTWRDLARELSLPDLVAAGDSALRLGVTAEQLRDVIDAGSQRHRANRARAALALLDKRSRSRPESHLRVAISGPDMPRFEVNESVYREEGGWLAEPDLSLAPARIALEYQGADHAGLPRMRKDITRFTDLRRAHWLVLPFGPAEVFSRPWQIKPELRQLIAERAPHVLPARRGRRSMAA